MNKNNENLILDYAVSVPLVVEELSIEGIKHFVEISSNIKSSELGMIVKGKEFVLPNWAEELNEKAKSTKEIVYLIISDIDELNFLEQDKFYSILKYSGINAFKFPENVRIILTAKKGGFAKLSKRIQSLCMVIRA